MKEVKLRRYAGPFKEPQYKHFIQSPIGLVPKDNGRDTRLIFHLSFDFGEQESERSFNYHTPNDLCTVKYRDLDHAIENCMKILEKGADNIFFTKSDLKSAFRVMPCKVSEFALLTMKANHPITGELFYFHDKCLAFGAGISCALFQSFSDSLQHIVEYLMNMKSMGTNYLDDFLFYSESEEIYNRMVRCFLTLCEQINCPVSLDKTEWATQQIIFLGILLNGSHKTLTVPIDKKNKAINLLKLAVSKKKVTVLTIQKLTGTLNFLNKAIVPGRAFTRGMYKTISMVNNQGRQLKQHHHVSLDRSFIEDCNTWLSFLNSEHPASKLCRPFLDWNRKQTSDTLQFYSDASGGIGLGAVFENRYIVATWPHEFLEINQPSIQFLELYALVAAVLTWGNLLANMRVEIFCDNTSVRDMCNDYTSSCPYYLKLIKLLVLDNLKWNRRVFVRYIKSKSNILADALSRQNFTVFWNKAPDKMRREPDNIIKGLWPPTQFFD